MTASGLRRFIILPLIINIFLFIGLFILFNHHMTTFNSWFESMLPAWLRWLDTVLWISFFISFFLFFIYGFVLVANIIAAPFNSLLAEKAEIVLTGKVPEQTYFLTHINNAMKSITRQFAIIFYYLPRALLILLLFFIPGLQIIAPFLWFLFNAWFMSLTYLDYPFDNHAISFDGMRQWLKSNRLKSFGFGISVLVSQMIPVFNLFTMPAAVLGATIFWVERNKDTTLES